ncbi:MAG: outer membrane lipoprotein-sorting protein, partial [Thermodesulfobacteriota bacterium]|nr:outer membrane lipoprotein-sorting protein [Thermodesulfobacteriota bacterium]
DERSQYMDNMTFYDFFMLYDKNGKLERTFNSVLRKKRWMGRLMFPPIPEFPGNYGVIDNKESIVILEPYDIKGFAMLRIIYSDVKNPDAVFSYIPAIRRIRRLTGSDVTDPMLGSDAIYDDFEVWRQKLNPKMTFKMRETESLVEIRMLGKNPGRFFKKTFQESEWEIRPFWILEIKTNEPDYVYSRRITWVERDSGGFGLPYSENYDQKGRLYRGSHCAHMKFELYKGNWYQDVAYGYIYADRIMMHTTVCYQNPIWQDPGCTAESFTLKGLLKQAK